MSYQLPSAFLQKFTPKEIHELKRVFKEHDHDYAAAITVGELHTVLLKMGENVAPSQVTTILKQVQLERSSHITFQEFLHLFYDLRNGGIALDPATLIANVSIAPIPSTASTPVASTPSTTVPSSAPVVQQVPFFPNKSAWTPSHDDQDDDDQHDDAATNTFAAKPQWPPAGTTSNAKPAWQSGTKPTPTPPKEASKWPPTNTPTPTTTAPSPTTKPTWPPTNTSTAPSPNAKPQWPPAAAQANTAPPVSPSKKTWPPTQANAAPTSPSKPTWPPTQPTAAPTSPSKPSWPPAAKPTAPTSPSKPSWPPSQPAATPASPPKPQWPPAAPSPARQEPSPSQKPKWPPAGTAAPTPPTPPTLDSHAIGVLERRASAVALYNANTTGTIHHVDSKSTSSKHSYSEEETAAFTEHINNCLQHDKDLSGLVPIRATNGLFQSVSDGVLLCKLVNAAVPETIDERAVNVRKVSKPQLNVYEMTENQNLCINAAKSIGCSVVNIGPTDLIEGRPILVLGLVWQIIKIQLTATINLKNHPELVRLLLDGESLEEFMKLPPDQILLRWMNYHLKAAGHPKQVTNFSSDMQDAHAYSVLLHQIAPQSCDLCRESVAEDRAAHVIQNARKLDIETFLKPRDITSGNPKLNMSFVAQLFNTCPALDVVEADLKQLEEILYDDSGDTREERVFRMWINSLGIDDVYINHLFSDVRDGINLLKVLDKIEKGIVAWQKVNLVAPNKFKQVENCNYCVVLGKQLKFSLVNIGGADIFEGNKKLILSVIWQSMRHFQLKLLSELAAKTLGHREITDNDIIQWANAKVAGGGKPGTRAIVAFRDLSLADGLYLLSLIHAVEPRAVNWEMVTTGQSDDDKNSNAKYAISCAQKIGATVFVTYEDIVEVKPKMIMTFVASLMSVDMHRR